MYEHRHSNKFTFGNNEALKRPVPFLVGISGTEFPKYYFLVHKFAKYDWLQSNSEQWPIYEKALPTNWYDYTLPITSPVYIQTCGKKVLKDAICSYLSSGSPDIISFLRVVMRNSVAALGRSFTTPSTTSSARIVDSKCSTCPVKSKQWQALFKMYQKLKSICFESDFHMGNWWHI